MLKSPFCAAQSTKTSLQRPTPAAKVRAEDPRVLAAELLRLPLGTQSPRDLTRLCRFRAPQKWPNLDPSAQVAPGLGPFVYFDHGVCYHGIGIVSPPLTLQSETGARLERSGRAFCFVSVHLTDRLPRSLGRFFREILDLAPEEKSLYNTFDDCLVFNGQPRQLLELTSKILVF
jgi:hypothetical protein